MNKYGSLGERKWRE